MLDPKELVLKMGVLDSCALTANIAKERIMMVAIFFIV